MPFLISNFSFLIPLSLLAVALWNWHKWRQDRALALHLRAVQEKATGTALPADCRRSRRLWGDGSLLTALPKVSVLVAAWNEAELIQEHIQSFLNLRYAHKELILCAGGQDGTYELAQPYAAEQVKLLQQQAGEGKQHALQRCWEQASGEVIFLTDADTKLNDEAFERTVTPVVCEGEAAATGRFAPLQSQRRHPFVLMQWYVDNYGRARSPAYVAGLIGRNAALERRIVDQIGGFSIPVSIGTDYHLAQRLLQDHVRIRYVRDSVVESEYVTGVCAYLRQQSRWLRNIVVHGRAFGATQQVRSALAQCLTGAAMLLWPTTFPVTSWPGLVLWVLLWFHGILSRFRYIAFGEITLRQARCWQTYLLALPCLVLDQFMLAYALIGLLLPRLRWSW